MISIKFRMLAAAFTATMLLGTVSAQQSIMVTGNSISAGFNRPSYRLPLLDELAAISCSVDMVGDQTLNSFNFRDPMTSPGENVLPFTPGMGYDVDHQAFPGIRAEELLSGVVGPYIVQPISVYTATEQPDYVLLHIGTNDLAREVFLGNTSPKEIDDWANETAVEVDSILNQIIGAHGSVKILLANLIPFRGPYVNQAQIDAAAFGSAIFPAKLAELVSAKGDSRVLYVDVASGFDIGSMTTDNIHPNQIGEEHMAGAFLPVLAGAGLCSANNIPFISAPANGSTVSGDPLSITWDDNGLTVDSWRVFVGDTQSGDSSTYFDSGVLGPAVNSVSVPSLPKDGSIVFISLQYVVSGVPQHVFTSFISEPASASAPEILIPEPGSVLPGPEVTFKWANNATTGITDWYFRAGSTGPGSEEYASFQLTNENQRSTLIEGLPVDGSRVYVEFSHRVGGIWTSEDLEYDAYGGTIDLPNNSWRQISLPATPPAGQDTVADIFADDIPGAYATDWQIFGFDELAGATGSYVDPGLTGVLEQGKAYWIIQDTGSTVTLDMPAGSTITPVESSSLCAAKSPYGCSSYSLAARNQVQWNMLGNPFYTRPSIDNLRVSTSTGACADADGCTLTEAADQTGANVQHNEFWSYNGSAYVKVGPGDKLEPWTGYWNPVLPGADGANAILRIPWY